MSCQTYQLERPGDSFPRFVGNQVGTPPMYKPQATLIEGLPAIVANTRDPLGRIGLVGGNTCSTNKCRVVPTTGRQVLRTPAQCKEKTFHATKSDSTRLPDANAHKATTNNPGCLFSFPLIGLEPRGLVVSGVGPFTLRNKGFKSKSKPPQTTN